MTKLKLLALGGGLGSVWVYSKEEVATADVGCAVNCADFTMRYLRGVRPYWLHISYHGRLGGTCWQDRVMGAMRLVLQTLLRGEDVAVHCKHGRHRSGFCFIIVLVFLSEVRGLPVYERLLAATDMYFSEHPDFQPGDHNENRVHGLIYKNLEGNNSGELEGLVAAMENEPLYQEVSANLPPPSRRRGPGSNAKARSRSPIRVVPRAKKMPKPKLTPKAEAKERSKVPRPRSEEPDEAKERSKVPRPRSEEPDESSSSSSSSGISDEDKQDWVERDCWACVCGSINLRFTQWCVCGLQRGRQEEWRWQATGSAVHAETSTSRGGGGVCGLTARPGIGNVSAAMSIGPAAAFVIAILAGSLVHGKDHGTACMDLGRIATLPQAKRMNVLSHGGRRECQMKEE